MKKQRNKYFIASLWLLAAFALWTAAVSIVDLQPIGPEASVVGFAALNSFVHDLTGVHWVLYDLTDLLSIIPLIIVVIFGLVGFTQLVKRKSLFKVDFDILVLGCFYVVVIGAFLLFEAFPVNYRPVLIEGILEASYPSSTTMLVLCVMPTAMLQIRARFKKCLLLQILLAAFTGFMVVARLISGVHWFTDILGGILLSGGLVLMYQAFIRK
jgi:undecaprenyl-diphosphatase